MAEKAFTRDSIPHPLRAAKSEAVARYFKTRGLERIRTRMYAASASAQDNLVGVGVGPKLKNGRPGPTHAVRFYVVSKLPKTAIPSEQLLPEKIGGVPTDVVEVGIFRAFAAVPPTQKRIRPAKPGCSVGFQFTGAKAQYVMAGTLGALVTDGNGARFLLSNNHVLADENNLPIGASIFQPGLLDHGRAPADAIATLTRFVRIDFANPNRVDCAIAKVNASNLASATALPKVGKLSSATPVDAAVGMKVHKTGRTTGYRTGVVFDVSADVRVNYEGGSATFENQVLIRGDVQQFSDSGDSGSMIVDRKTKCATALLFAGSATHTIANHMSDVLAELNVTLIV